MPSEQQIIKYLDNLRTSGFRPTLICALVVNQKVALFSSNKYPGWEFLQGGIEFNEIPQETLEREIAEELGYHFLKDCSLPVEKFIWLFEDKLKTAIKDKVISNSGKQVKTNTKHYIIFAAILSTGRYPEINSDDYGFTGTTVKLHSVRWVGYKEALKLIGSIKNEIKREILRETLHKLKDKQLIVE